VKNTSLPPEIIPPWKRRERLPGKPSPHHRSLRFAEGDARKSDDSERIVQHLPYVKAFPLNDNRRPRSRSAGKAEGFDDSVASSGARAQIDYKDLVFIVLDNVRERCAHPNQV